MLIKSLLFISLVGGHTPVKLSDPDGEISRFAREEVTTSAKRALDPKLENSAREFEIQSLLTQLEMLGELSRLSLMVSADPGKNTWYQVALQAAGKLDSATMQSLLARLRHKDPIVQQMGLQRLADEMEARSIGANKEMEAAQLSFMVGDLAKALTTIYYRATAVQPVLMSQMKNTTSNRQIAERLSRELEDVLQQTRKEKNRRR